jgi:hypothetical protein
MRYRIGGLSAYSVVQRPLIRLASAAFSCLSPPSAAIIGSACCQALSGASTRPSLAFSAPTGA